VSALLSSGWDFFPSVDQVISVINANRQAAADASRNREWEIYKENQRKAEAEGRLATQAEKDELREVFRKIAETPVPFTHRGKQVAITPLPQISNEELEKSVEAARKFVASNQEAKSIYKRMERDTKRRHRDAGSVFKG